MAQREQTQAGAAGTSRPAPSPCRRDDRDGWHHA